jgi:hypothetical protein
VGYSGRVGSALISAFADVATIAPEKIRTRGLQVLAHHRARATLSMSAVVHHALR